MKDINSIGYTLILSIIINKENNIANTCCEFGNRENNAGHTEIIL